MGENVHFEVNCIGDAVITVLLQGATPELCSNESETGCNEDKAR